MKVKALCLMQQTVGNLNVERAFGSVFELDESTAIQAAAAGLVELLESPKKPTAKNRETK